MSAVVLVKLQNLNTSFQASRILESGIRISGMAKMKKVRILKIINIMKYLALRMRKGLELLKKSCEKLF